MMAIHAPAVSGSAPSVTLTNASGRPPSDLDGLDTYSYGGMRSPSQGFHWVPRYNQRKARKLARSSGRHPANAQRR
jgi:hypothetical protein